MTCDKENKTMTKEPFFTEQELKEMGTRTADLIVAAIDSGDLEKAKTLTRRMLEEALRSHDFYVYWVTSLLSHIYRGYGDDALYKAVNESYGNALRPTLEKTVRGNDFRKKVENVASGQRGHLQPIEIVEDDEKVTLMMQPCGSGGRLMLNRYYEPPADLAKVKKAQNMTFDKEEFPIYCIHCPIGEIIALESAGLPLFALEPGERIGEDACKFHIYKMPNAIPAEFYERFGWKKRLPTDGR